MAQLTVHADSCALSLFFAVDAIVRDAKVVLATAGPFGLYGDPVVDACVR